MSHHYAYLLIKALLLYSKKANPSLAGIKHPIELFLFAKQGRV
ncbi:hypothetical protein DB41_CT00060 [Neochlamydia sp. TUME1]|nr:hypothetical protein DB41_CT00060 [Neochlamydia sp. TUME1]